MAILTYHHIGVCPPEQRDHPGLWVTPDLFKAQLLWLRGAGYEGVSLDHVREGLLGERPLPRRWVSLTFDDGWRDNYLAALPVLEETRFSATVFMVTDKIRAVAPSGAWDEYLSEDEITEMMTRGVAIGSHTMTHRRLTKLTCEEARREMEGSRERLRTILGAPPAWLCYPYGNFAPRTAKIAREVGYAGALSTIRDNRPGSHQLFWLPRVMVMGDTTPGRLKYMLSGVYHCVHAWKNRRRWKSLSNQLAGLSCERTGTDIR